MNARGFPDIDERLSRPFPVHENCYDCAEFYHGCTAWPERRPFACADYCPLPDVMPGTCGQVFPPSRTQGRKEPRVRQEPAAVGHSDSPCPASVPGWERPAVSRAGPRLCECGAALPKSKRLCESCRVERRRQTMREYMRNRRTARPASEDITDMPLFATTRAATHASSDDLLPTGLPAGGARSKQTSV
jgi:hypothetical protein